MIKLITSLFFATSLALQAKEPQLNPAMVRKQLDQAETDFENAKKMFNPWYAGPLLAPSASLVPPGSFNIQPYLFVTTNYAKYSKNGRVIDTPNLVSINPQFIFQFGMFKKIEGIVSVQSVTNRYQGKSSTHFGDSSFALGISLFTETPYYPGVLLSIKETLPTGKYQKLDPKKLGTDSSGGGVFATSFSLNLAKVVWWWSYAHPIAFRGSFSYTLPSCRRIEGFNTYGGGYGTKGKIHTPQTFSFDGAFEYSFTQRWVFACDFVYTYSSKSYFVGKNGVDLDGNEASTGGPFSDNLSIAPALEYNFNPNLGILLGGWFSYWGRNSSDFASGIFTVTYSF